MGQWHQLYRLLKCAIAAGLCVWAGAACPAPAATLVLSGDEVLQQGPISIDQADLHASVSPGAVQISGIISSEIAWPMSGRVSIALRNLDETVISSGAQDLAGNGRALAFSAELLPGLTVADESEYAAYVVHIEIGVNGHTLRLRRSLYAAVPRADLELRLPRRLRRGEPFPTVAALTSPGVDTALIDFSLPQTAMVPALELGAIAVQSDGTAAGLVPLPHDAALGRTLAADLIAPQRRQRLSTTAQVDSGDRLELLLAGSAAAPGDVVHLVSLLRSGDGSARARSDGECCLGRAGGDGFACHGVRTDDAGVALARFAIGDALRGAELDLSCRFGEAQERTPLNVAAQASLDAVSIALDADVADQGRTLAARLRVVGWRPGLRYHAELRLDDADGPLVAELEGAVASPLTTFDLPVPDLAAVAATRWFLIAGVEDPTGRRSAAWQARLAASSDAVIALHLPQRVVAGEPFEVVAQVRDTRGRPLGADGTVSLGGQERPLHVDASGLATVTGLIPGPGEVEITAEVATANGAHANDRARVLVVGANAARIALELEPFLSGAGDAAADLHASGQAKPLGMWLSADGVVLDAALGAVEHATLSAGGEHPLLTVHGFGVDDAGQLLSASQFILGPPSQILIEAGQQPDGSVQLDVRRRGGQFLATSVVVDSVAEAPATSTAVSLGAIHGALLGVAEPRAQLALLNALDRDRGVAEVGLRSETSAQAIAISQAKVEADLKAIATDIAERIERDDLAAHELEPWVERRERVYYDPWGQTYLFEIADGRLWLRSLGLDEQDQTADDINASVYTHTISSPLPTSTSQASGGEAWLASVRSPQLEVLSVGADPLTLSGQQATRVRVQDQAGATAELSLEPSGAPRFELAARTAIPCRRGDAFELPVTLDAAPGSSVTLTLTSESPSSVQVRPAVQDVVADSDGMARSVFDVLVLDDLGATLHAAARQGPRTAHLPIDVAPRPDEGDRVVLDSAARALVSSSATQLRLIPRGSSSRRAPVLRAALFSDTRQLAAYLRAQSRPRRPATLRTAVLDILLLGQGAPPPPTSLDRGLARIATLQASSGGVAFTPSSAPQTEASLEALEALAAAQKALATAQVPAWRAVSFLGERIDSEGALPSSVSTGDATTQRRERLRSTARYARALATLDADPNLSAAPLNFLLEHLDEADDVRSQARVLRALAALQITEGADSLRAALLEHARSVEGSETELYFPGLAGDGPEADLVATSLALLALTESNSAAPEREHALTYLSRWAHPRRPRLSPHALHLLLAALDVGTPASAPVIVDLRVPGMDPVTLSSEADPVSLSADLDAQGHLDVEVGPGSGIALLWLEGSSTQARSHGPELRLLAADRVRVGAEPVALPIIAGESEAALLFETRVAPCVEVALAVDGKLFTAEGDGHVVAALSSLEQGTELALVLAATCDAQISLPALKVYSDETPWLVSTPAPRLVEAQVP